MNKTFCDRCGCEVKETDIGENFMRFGHIEGREILYQKGYDLCFDCIKDLREWIKHPRSLYISTAEWADNKCSNCGKGIENLIDSREWYENEKPNYCPFCGTRFIMKGCAE